MGIAPLTGDGALPLLIYSVIYFALVILVSLYPGKLLDTVGNFGAAENYRPGRARGGRGYLAGRRLATRWKPIVPRRFLMVSSMVI